MKNVKRYLLISIAIITLCNCSSNDDETEVQQNDPDIIGNINYNTVLTFAGENGTAGHVNNIGGLAQFGNPFGLNFDNDNNLFVVDTDNEAIRKISENREVTTVFSDFPGFSPNIRDIAVDSQGNLFVVSALHVIYKIDVEGEITSFAGNGIAGLASGAGLDAQFNWPSGLCIDVNDNLYIADTNNNAVRKVTPEGLVSTVAIDVVGLKEIRDIVLGPDNNLYAIDTDVDVIHKITLEGNVSTFAVAFRPDGANPAIKNFHNCHSIDVDNAGYLFVTDAATGNIMKIDPEGVVSKLTGNGFGYNDGGLEEAQFIQPGAITVSDDGSLYISDTAGNTIRKIE